MPGASVVAIDLNLDRLEKVWELALDPRALACNSLRRGGRACVIGFSDKPVELSAPTIMVYELEVIGSLGCGGGASPEILRQISARCLRRDALVSGTVSFDDRHAGLGIPRNGEWHAFGRNPVAPHALPPGRHVMNHPNHGRDARAV